MKFKQLLLDHDERAISEAEPRGYLQGAFVELSDGSKHPVFFYDAGRLTQDLEEEVKRARPFLAEKGMIILEAVTVENMKRAVEALAEEGFFDR
jgi:hypothetical protein